MTTTDWLMIMAVLLAPVLAVQVQKELERYREQQSRKIWIFKTLMATRAALTSPEHVQALNMIDLEFRGKKFIAVNNAWKVYFDHLTSFPVDDEIKHLQWLDKRFDLLAILLLNMGKAVGYDFDEVYIKKSVYSPEAHSQIEMENRLIRQGVIKILHGESALKIDIDSIPSTIDSEQEHLRAALTKVLLGDKPINVSFIANSDKK